MSRTLAKVASRRRRFQLTDGSVVPDPFGRRELYAVDSDTQATNSPGWLTLGVRRWRYLGSANGWRRAEMTERRQVPTEDPVAVGEAQAELEQIAEPRNQAAWGLKVASWRPRWLWRQSDAGQAIAVPLHGGVGGQKRRAGRPRRVGRPHVALHWLARRLAAGGDRA